MRASTNLPAPGGVSGEWLRAAFRQVAPTFDPAFGGFGGAPKFPNPALLSLLLRYYRTSGDDTPDS